jgi:hypothetical protein
MHVDGTWHSYERQQVQEGWMQGKEKEVVGRFNVHSSSKVEAPTTCTQIAEPEYMASEEEP